MDHLTLTLRHASCDAPNRFVVCVSGRGVPDFHVEAKDMNAALEMLADYVYNAFDGQEDIIDDSLPEA